MPYTPTWNNPYVTTNPYQQAQVMPTVQPMAQQFQQPWNSVKVDGAPEAMNRFLMHYPATMLMPGFVSEPLFDIDGRHFHTLSIEADGRRNLETFRYSPEVKSQGFRVDDAQFVSRAEFDDFTKKVNAALGALNGVHAAVPTAATAAPAQPGNVDDAGQDRHAQEPSRGQLAGVGGAAVPIQ